MWEQLITFVQEQLQTNELFKGGLLLMVGGGLLALLRPLPKHAWGFVKRQAMVVIDIPDKDPAFRWVNEWLGQHNYSKNRARLLTVKSARTKDKRDKPNIIFSPAPGTHYLWYQKRLVILTRSRKDQNDGTPSQDPFREVFVIKILGRGRDVVKSLINEAYETSQLGKKDELTLHRGNEMWEWYSATTIRGRDTQSVILEDDYMQRLVDDIQEFFSSESWYVERGIPYQRGYLLYGLPGNGKTSAIISLATYFNKDIGIINLGAEKMSDDCLVDLMSQVPSNTIILFEDIDCLVDQRDTKTGVTFSGLLNALDGVGASHGQVVFMTTNKRHDLDSALIRPGRCDLQIEFRNATPEQAARMFSRFFPDSSNADKFGRKVAGQTSMAQLQQHLMLYRQCEDKALNTTIGE